MGNFTVETVRENQTEDKNADSNGNGNHETENLESLLSSFGENTNAESNNKDGNGDDDGDDFVSAEDAEAKTASERRRKRKRRLESLEAIAVAEEASAENDKSILNTKTVLQPPVLASEIETKIKVEHEIKIESSVDGNQSKENVGNDDGNDDDDDDGNGDSDSDDSDMFGSPSSEDKALKHTKKKSKDPQNPSTSNTNATSKTRLDGFDDSDGYYKASIGETMELEVLGGGPSKENDRETETKNGIGIEDEDEETTLRLRVLGVIGKGVFSSVLKCSTAATTMAAATTTTTTTAAHSDGIPASISLGGPNGDTGNNVTSNDQKQQQKHQQQHGLPSEVAIKCIRSNETMSKAALNEMKFLIRLRDSPGIVPLLLPSPAPQQSSSNSGGGGGTTTMITTNPNYVPPPIDFRGHTVLVFPYLPYNLRDVLQKFGKGVGLSLAAVQNYLGQLLRAATHLQKHKVIHADIKPDNILVSADFSTVLVADFGSAFESSQLAGASGDDGEEATQLASASSGAATHEAVTPYLVSRFYRAPEIILGLQPMTYAIDLWSLAVTAGELFLGKVLLKGANNNDMLYAMMETLGPFSGRIIKNHLLQTKKHPLPAHFSQVQSNFVFKQETVDPVLGKAVHKELALVGHGTKFKPTLQSRLLKAKSPKDTRADIVRFADLLNKCLVLDPSKRIGVRAALKHDFFSQKK